MLVKNHGPFVYQIRMGVDKDPSDLITEMTQSVWQALIGCSIDPHRWPGLYLSFRDIFRRRLMRYPNCGRLAQCQTSLRSLYGRARSNQSFPQVTYTLEVTRDMEGFSRALSYVACRRVRDQLPASAGERRSLLNRLKSAIERALSGYLFFSDLCENCQTRKEMPDTRHWE